MSTHTPGPWKVHQRPTKPIQYGHHVTTNDGLTICDVSYQLPDKDGESTRVANARLIAAAPELLEALESLLEMGHAKAGALARAAIAKATGKQA